MGEAPRFYRNAEDWSVVAERLKLTPCPHCKVVGMLIRHGFLRGFDDGSPPRVTVCARRVFCSNRQARRGCGRTFSVRLADRIRRLVLTTGALWRFLRRAVGGGILAAIRAAECPLSDRTWQRLWKRFDQAQCMIRTALSTRCPPPQWPPPQWPPPQWPPLPPPAAPPSAAPPRRPAAAQVLAHLLAAFPDADCPIAAFQQTLQIPFV